MLHPNFVIVGVIIGAIGSVVYLINTLKGKVKPNRVSFLLWTIAPFIIFAAQVKQGVGMVSLMTFSAGFFPLLIFIASYVNKKAKWKVTKRDLLLGAISLAGLILWIITKVGNIAIVFNLIADIFAAIPTITKAYKYPETEIAWPWLATIVGGLLSVLTIKVWAFENYSFLFTLLILNSIIYSFVQFRIGDKINSLRK